MNAKRWIGLCAAMLAVSLAGCGGKEPSAEAEKAKPASTAAVSPSPEASGEPSASPKDGKQSADIEIQTKGGSADAPKDQGSPNVWVKGEATVKDKSLFVKGSTNLLPGVKIRGNITAKGYSMFGYDGEVEIGADGSFELELKRPDIKGGTLDVELRFRPDYEAEPVKEVYGKHGEKLEGPYIYRYEDTDEIHGQVLAFARMDSKAAADTKVSFETPEWEKPADYGNAKVWIKPEVTFDDKFYYVTAKSNLLEGAKVKANVDIPDHIHFGYTDNSTVNPDGSFKLQISKPKDVKMFYLLIQYEPGESDMWPDAKQAYGEKGEKLQGDLLKVKQTDKGAIKMIEMKVKVNSGK